MADTTAPTFPVVEIFGPVIEGEGPLAGARTMYVRFGLCDYRCAHCDSMHAVDPERVKANAEDLTSDTIFNRVRSLAGEVRVVTFSGGNPALWELGPLMRRFQGVGFQVKVETQGSVWKPWLAEANHLMISPKPPSMIQSVTLPKLDRFMSQLVGVVEARGMTSNWSLKIVVFDETDLKFALHIWQTRFSLIPLWLSIGTMPTDNRDDLGTRYREILEMVLSRTADIRGDIRVMPQLHVFAYLHLQGV